MRSLKTTLTGLLAFALLSALACSGKGVPTLPDEPARALADFESRWRVVEGTDTAPCTDVATLVHGPLSNDSVIGDPVQLSYLMEERHWAVAVWVEPNTVNGDRIRFAWLDDVMSPEGETAVAAGVLLEGKNEYDVDWARVSACYFYNDQDPDESLIEVAVAYRYKEKGTGNNWDIGVYRRLWEQEGFPRVPGEVLSIYPVIFEDDHEEDDEDDDFCPDLAYDPVTGDIHVVWTTGTTAGGDPERLAYAWWDYSEWEWDEGSDQCGYYIVYEENTPHQMWHPRIDVGDAGLESPSGDVVGVVFNAYSGSYGPNQNDWHIGGAFWAVNTDPESSCTFTHNWYDGDEQCGMPRIDIAPRSNDDDCFSVVFTNEFANDQYQVIEVNNIRNDYLAIVHDEEDEGVYGVPAIHYGSNDVSVTYFQPVSPGPWEIWATRFGLDDEEMSNEWAPVVGAVDGDFDPYSETAAPGVETAIITESGGGYDNGCWAAWCNEIDSTPDEVWVAYGDSQ